MLFIELREIDGCGCGRMASRERVTGQLKRAARERVAGQLKMAAELRRRVAGSKSAAAAAGWPSST